MSRGLVSPAWVSFVVVLAACVDSPASPITSGDPPLPAPQAPTVPTPTVVGIAVSPESTSVALGDNVTLTTYKVMSNGAKVLIPWPSFTSGAMPPQYHVVGFTPAVTVNSASGVVSAIAPGLAKIQATYEGMTAFSTIHVRAPVASNSVALKVESFSVIEYNQSGSFWVYAPQLTVSASSSTSVTVLSVQFTVPGWSWPSLPWQCGGHVPANASRELNGEVYGSWTWEMSSTDRATGGDVKAKITFVDETGSTGTVEVSGHVVKGDWPSTYGGEPGACFHGYRGGGS